MSKLSDIARGTQAKVFDNQCKLLVDQRTANETQIAEYEAQCKRLQDDSSPGSSVVVDFQDTYADKAGIPRAVSVPSPATGGKNDSDFWIPISTEISSHFSHEEAGVLSNPSKQLSNSSARISFEYMRVDISRPWLSGELFYDDDLRVGPGD